MGLQKQSAKSDKSQPKKSQTSSQLTLQQRTELAMKSCRFAKATGTREKREQRLVLLHISLEGLGIVASQVPESESVARVIKKLCNYKMSPERAALEIKSIIGA